MNRGPPAAPWRSLVASLGVLVCSVNCTSWKIVELAPAEYLQSHRPKEVRLTCRDSSRIRLRAPELRGDSLAGHTVGGLSVSDTTRVVTMPLADVHAMEVRRFSFIKSLGLYLIIAVPLALAMPPFM